MFMKGNSNKAVAEKLQVGADTVARYRKEYEERISEIAKANPGMLRKVIENTIVALEENSQIRQHAWEEYEALKAPRDVECPSCGASMAVPGGGATIRNQLLKTILAAQDQRARIFGLFGVKQEFFIMVQNVRIVQEKLTEFLRTRLTPEQRQEVESFMVNELGEYLGSDLPSIPAEVLEVHER